MEKSIFVDSQGCVFLRREKQQRPLHIGTLKGDVLTVTKQPNHLYVLTNSYGFNRAMVTNLSFDTLRVCQLPSGEVLETTKLYLLHKGIKYEHESFEPQIFLPLKEFGLERARQFDEELKRKQKVKSINIYEGIEMLKQGGKS